MPKYSSPEVDNRAKDIVSLLQAKLAEVGIKSEVSHDWYFHTLVVLTPELYQAVSIHEGIDRSHLVICFETKRLGVDGEILYRGVNIEENAGSFDEVFEEAKRQNYWVKRRIERRAQVAQEHQRAMEALNRVQVGHPGYKIHLTDEGSCRFGMTLQGLTEERLEEVIKFIEGA